MDPRIARARRAIGTPLGGGEASTVNAAMSCRALEAAARAK
jgi:hypothetical protein